MQITPLSSEEFDGPELEEFLSHFFLNQEQNNGYRWFSRENIDIDFKKRELVFHLNPEYAHWGTKNFESRVDADQAFNNGDFGFIPGFEFEQKMFDLRTTQEEETNAINYTKPQIGGKVAITETSLYVDELGEMFIAIPLAIPDETYGLSGKLTGSYLHGGSQALDTGKVRKLIDPRAGKREWNTLFDLQEKNPRDKIIQEIDNFKLGEWTVKFALPNGRYTKMVNVHIGRANDGAFEIVSSHLFRSYEDIVGGYNIRENIGFDRPVSLVKVSDLLSCEDGESLGIQKLFFQNNSISPDELPDEYKSSIQKDDKGDVFIHNFTRTPPLRIFEGKLKTLLLTEDFQKVVQSLMDRGGEGDSNKLDVSGAWSELEFGKKYGIKKNTKIFSFEIKLPDSFSKIINNNPNFSEDEKEGLIGYIQRNNLVGNAELSMQPDFVLNGEKGKTFIEYKASKSALRKQQSKDQSIRAAIIQIFGNNNINYNTIVGSNYGIDDISKFDGCVRQVSELHLFQKGVETSEDLLNFFQ